MTAPQTQASPQPTFPTIRVGGLFILAAGFTTLVALLLRGASPLHPGLFLAGMMVAVFGILLNPWVRNRFSQGIQTTRQRDAIRGAIVFEAISIIVVCQCFPDDLQTRWLWIFLIVGLHFIPMQLSHSGWIAFLGGLLVVNAIAGLSTILPFQDVAVIDGLLKLVCGLKLFLLPMV
ncbi:MAG TPA: DUF6609 family protein [Coleofasciculaceae cyanobacterium]|jgi:hypothetical protein